MQMRIDDVRRLTGVSLLSDQPGAALDVVLLDVDVDQFVRRWQHWAPACLEEMGWSQHRYVHRLHQGGANLAISAPLDALYIACDLIELIFACCVADLSNAELPDWRSQIKQLSEQVVVQSNSKLRHLAAQAKQRGVLCFVDDDYLSLGSGQNSQCWSINQLPDPQQIDWSHYHNIPTALVTGTNGKSTCVRLAACIAKAAGLRGGITSTDFVKVADEVLDHGDYSGPGGARTLLRSKQVEIAFLEVARGGLLRRGVETSQVDAALVTNVACDHLGEYGINTVEELAQTKFVVAKAVKPDGVMVLNADDDLSIKQSQSLDQDICWFSTKPNNPLIEQQLKSGAAVVTVRDGKFVYAAQGKQQTLLEVSEAPFTFNGSAVHNVENALAVIGLCKALGLSSQAIVTGLREFGTDYQDNPGRGNRYQLGGKQVIVDFAHNDHGVNAVVEMAKQIPAQRRIVMFGHAGDRSDDDIKRSTDAVAALNADLFVLSELSNHLRGRSAQEIRDLVSSTLSKRGIGSDALFFASNPLVGAQHAVEFAQDGDLVLLFVLDQRPAVHQWLSQQDGATTA